jgi:hypothetical protein
MFSSSLRTSLVLLSLVILPSSTASTHSKLLDIAVDAIARATTSSQVLSLDLTSVILLLVLKIIIAFVQWVNGVESGRSFQGIGHTGMCLLKTEFREEEMVECLKR